MAAILVGGTLTIKNYYMMTVKVKQLASPKSGRPVANQFEISTNEGLYFQSYNSIILFIPDWVAGERGKIVLDAQYWDYSRTTGKYRNMFLDEGINETRKKIKDGTYQLANLN